MREGLFRISFVFLLLGSYFSRAQQGDTLYLHTVNENSINNPSGVIYPNPVGGKINLKFILSQPQNIDMNIEDGKGKVLLHDFFFNVQDGDIRVLDLNSLENGIYLLRLYSKNFVFTRKLVKIPD